MALVLLADHLVKAVAIILRKSKGIVIWMGVQVKNPPTLLIYQARVWENIHTKEVPGGGKLLCRMVIGNLEK